MHDDNITQETPNEGLGKEHPTPSPKSIVLKHSEISAFIRGKRIAAFDFGKVRTGFAVCDEFHITVSTKGIFQTADKEFYPSILAALERERIGLIIVGVPFRLDGETTSVIKSIHNFIRALRKRVAIPVVEQDESFTSKRAIGTMIDIGVKKKDRRNKARTDEVSAAILLRDFLEEFE